MRLPVSILAAGLIAVLAGCTPPKSESAAGGPGGTAASAPGASATGGKLTLGIMPKIKGIPYFNACQKGAEEAAKELGDVELVFDGPIDAKSERQTEMLDTWVTRKFNAISVACNDPDQIAPSLAHARDAGIAVTTFDADANPSSSKRQFFVNQVAVEDLAQALVEEMVKQTGPEAEVAIVSSSPTAPNQSAWIQAMDAYRGKHYPKLKVVTTEYGEESQPKSEEKAASILKAYPNVKGLWGLSSNAFPGAAGAVDKAGKAGKVAVVGLATPNPMKEYVKKGVVKSVVLWSPVDLGYLTVQVTRAVAKGDLKPGATSFKAGRLGEVKVSGDMVLLGKPLIFTKETIDKYDF